MPRSEFPEDIQLEVGHIIGFIIPSGQELPGVINVIKETEFLKFRS